MPFAGGVAVKKYPAVSNCTRFKLGDFHDKSAREAELKKASGVAGYIRAAHGIPEAVVAAPARVTKRGVVEQEPVIFPTRIEARLNKVLDDVDASHLGKVFRRGDPGRLQQPQPREAGHLPRRREDPVNRRSGEDLRDRRNHSSERRPLPRMQSPVSPCDSFLNIPDEVGSPDREWSDANANRHSIFSPLSVFSLAPKKSAPLTRPRRLPDTDLTQIPSVKQSLRHASNQDTKRLEEAVPVPTRAIKAMQDLCQRVMRPGEYREAMRKNFLGYVTEAREMMRDGGASSDEDVQATRDHPKRGGLARKDSRDSLRRIFPSPSSTEMAPPKNVALQRRLQKHREETVLLESREKVENYLRGCPGGKSMNTSRQDASVHVFQLEETLDRGNLRRDSRLGHQIDHRNGERGEESRHNVDNRRQRPYQQAKHERQPIRSHERENDHCRELANQNHQIALLQHLSKAPKGVHAAHLRQQQDPSRHNYNEPSREKVHQRAPALAAPRRQDDATVLRETSWKRPTGVLTPPYSQGSPLTRPPKRFSRDESHLARQSERYRPSSAMEVFDRPNVSSQHCYEDPGDGLPEFGEDFERAFSRKPPGELLRQNSSSSNRMAHKAEAYRQGARNSHDRGERHVRESRNQSPSPTPRRFVGRRGDPTPAVSIAALTEYPDLDDLGDLGKTPYLSCTLDDVYAAMEETKKGGNVDLPRRPEHRSRRDQHELQLRQQGVREERRHANQPMEQPDRRVTHRASHERLHSSFYV